jgi:hypothetical protein
MTFALQNWSRQSAASNCGQDSQGFGGPAIFSYRSGTDAVAVIAAADYFAPAVFELSVKDIIFIRGSDAFAAYEVDTLDREAGTITLASIGLTNAIGTANIVDGAITTVKLADDAVTTVKILDENVTSDKLELALVKHARVTMTAAEWNGMYVAPFELVADPTATEMVILHGIKIDEDYGGTVFANGGAIHVQYDSTTLGAGPKATDTFAAATFIGFVADTHFGLTPVQTGLADATTIGKGLYLSNATGAFTGGAGSAFIVDVWYSVVDYA